MLEILLQEWPRYTTKATAWKWSENTWVGRMKKQSIGWETLQAAAVRAIGWDYLIYSLRTAPGRDTIHHPKETHLHLASYGYFFQTPIFNLIHSIVLYTSAFIVVAFYLGATGIWIWLTTGQLGGEDPLMVKFQSRSRPQITTYRRIYYLQFVCSSNSNQERAGANLSV